MFVKIMVSYQMVKEASVSNSLKLTPFYLRNAQVRGVTAWFHSLITIYKRFEALNATSRSAQMSSLNTV